MASAPRISLVIPGRNCENTIRTCLDSVIPLLNRGEVCEIIFVDDGSTDATAKIVARYPIRVIAGQGGGAGAARNLGWRAAQGELVWFIDSDCVAESDALARLLPQLADETIAGVGGSYGNMRPDSLVACLIHEEIVARHACMAGDVDFLSTFNVLYRRDVLAAVGGFDEHRVNGPGVAGAEDTELAFRLAAAGYRLRFTPDSRVRHFHLTDLGRYLRVQQRHGFLRVRLYLEHPERISGDSYSGWIDHAQPPLAMLVLATALLACWPPLGAIPLTLALALLALQAPMALRLVVRTRSWAYLAYVPFGFLRAFRRGLGFVTGVVANGARLAFASRRAAVAR